MAQKKAAAKKTTSKKRPSFDEYEFLNHTMTRAEKEQFDNWEITADDFALALDRVIDGDYKLSVANDDYNKCVTASLTCRDTNNDDCGLILTARAPGAFDALRLVLFKHLVLLKDGWWAFRERGQEDGVWG